MNQDADEELTRQPYPEVSMQKFWRLKLYYYSCRYITFKKWEIKNLQKTRQVFSQIIIIH